ncbi:MAG TPA: P1 family peptidase [Gemmatimonadota bacterium]|nr:P1 family peptidase [Gemmatimonadota bacterium]
MVRALGRLVTMGAALGLAFPAAACARHQVVESAPGGDRMIPRSEAIEGSIRRVPGVFAGHHTLAGRPTGCTVVLTPDGATGGVDVRGGAPGTRETDLLDPVNSVQQVHGIVLSGGSAFGLETAGGVMRFLEEGGFGFPAGPVRVPIVPAAILFDLSIGDSTVRPGADCGYRAAEAAMRADAPLAEGNVGAGAGATVGKVAGIDRAMKGGIGNAVVELPSGLVVAAIVAVNAAGDVVDPTTGRTLAGVRTEQGDELAGAMAVLREQGAADRRPGSNTVIGIVATNAALTQAEATKVAQMAHDGVARTIVPSHTPWDGDTVFALATGEHEGTGVTTIGAFAAEVVAEAIVRAIRAAESIDGIPALADMPHYDDTPDAPR